MDQAKLYVCRAFHATNRSPGLIRGSDGICIQRRGFDRYSGTMPLIWDFSAWFSVSSGFSTSVSCSASHFSASRAAMHPEPFPFVSSHESPQENLGADQNIPALVIACRYFLSCTSPAANTPSTSVNVLPGSVIKYPSSSIFNWPLNNCVAGSCPTA